MTLCVSCKKDKDSSTNNGGGSTTPIKKISEVYFGYYESYEVSYDDGQTWEEYGNYSCDDYLYISYNWEDDHLASIDYYDIEGNNYEHESFSYNESDLVKRISSYYNYIWGNYTEDIEYTYNGNKIISFNAYFDDELYASYDITYSGNKPTKFQCTYRSSYDYAVNDKPERPRTHSNLLKQLKKAHSKDGELPYITLKWNGNNISKIEWFDEDYYSEETYTYDSKKSPFSGNNSLTAKTIFKDGLYKLSQNNIKSMAYGDNVDTYTYIYSDNYPTRQNTIFYYFYTDEETGAIYRNTFDDHYEYIYLDD